MKIERIRGREIYDSRGYPTIACDLLLHNGSLVTASVPAGASRSTHEAKELRDGGTRLMGLGVQKAIEKIETMIAPMFIGKEPNIVDMDIKMLQLDETDDKSNLGANTMLAVSIAICRAQAIVEMMDLYELLAHLCEFEAVSLPAPMLNVINGGLHAHNNLSVQEILIIPSGMDSFKEAMVFGATAYHILKNLLHEHGKSTAVGDEGGFAASFANTQEALGLVQQAIEQTESLCGGVGTIGLDIAASQLYDPKSKRYTIDGQSLTTNELIAWYMQLCDAYPITALEDGLHEDDWDGWEQMSEVLQTKATIIGDDIFATNPQRIYKGIEADVAQGVIIKPNQVGTVTETLQAIQLCDESGIQIIASHRSGDTNDTFIADLAIAASATYIKAGGCSRGERMAKYNHILMIEDALTSSYEKL
ncbi:MAG TPA: phosphopyruvate hydratase [Candidatus Dependentiae bacterium]|nr:phosphopyruvate hydratase [Candidatus Dependentiae bacterium]HRQ62988.1 phosphopyruvate hydratase [Candidatus Dependentiae bacterium]